MDVVNKYKTNLGGLNDKENYSTYNEGYHKELSNVDLDRSSLNEENPN